MTQVEPARYETITKGSELLVAALENEGVDRVFGIPGEENLGFVEALTSQRHDVRDYRTDLSQKQLSLWPIDGSKTEIGKCGAETASAKSPVRHENPENS
jgi:hypothetical protein